MLFALGNILALVFVPIGLVTRKDGIGYMIVLTSGMFIAIFALMTDSIIYEYSDRITTANANSTGSGFTETCTTVVAVTTCVNTPTTSSLNTVNEFQTVRISEPFEDLPKTMFMLIGGFIMIAGAFLLVRDK